MRDGLQAADALIVKQSRTIAERGSANIARLLAILALHRERMAASFKAVTESREAVARAERSLKGLHRP